MRIVVCCLALVFGAASAQGLFDAARSGSVADVGAALAAGDDVGGVDDGGHTPLLLAVWHNGPDVVAALLDAGADPHYANPKTGMGIFGLVWRNPESAAIRALFEARSLVPQVGPGAAGDAGAEAPAPAASTLERVVPAAPAAPTAAPAREAPPTVRTQGASPDRPSPARAAELGYVRAPRADFDRSEIRDWATSRYAVSGPLTAELYVVGCRSAVLDLVRSPETVLFGDMGSVGIDDDGVMTYATDAVARRADDRTLRWSLRCTGFVEEGTLHLWVEIETR